ncbi:hypothetical protein [Neisseria polysaccharea]|uniref:hypothetical protein n=1 Tax=Neisseria polysaccharea TaxID=489 RepID=UPI0027298555|nr:hypothetical protein [Neisseria polysaccharea]
MTKGCGKHGNSEALDGIIHPLRRHSRAGGNPDLRAAAIFKDDKSPVIRVCRKKCRLKLFQTALQVSEPM